MFVSIQLGHEQLAVGDERLADHARPLIRDLKFVVPITQGSVVDPGHKGGAAEIILALGSAGVVAAVLEIFRLWITKDGKRKIRLTAKVKGVENVWEISAEGMPQETIERALMNLLAEANDDPA